MTRAGLPFASGTISRSICSVSGSPVFDHTLIVREAGLPHNVSRDSLRRTLLTSSPRLAVSSSSAEAAKGGDAVRREVLERQSVGSDVVHPHVQIRLLNDAMQDLVFQFEHRLRLAQLVFLLFLLGHVRQRGEEDGAVLLAAQEEGAHAHPHDLAVQSVPTKGGFGSRDGALVRFGEHALYEGRSSGCTWREIRFCRSRRSIELHPVTW